MDGGGFVVVVDWCVVVVAGRVVVVVPGLPVVVVVTATVVDVDDVDVVVVSMTTPVGGLSGRPGKAVTGVNAPSLRLFSTAVMNRLKMVAGSDPPCTPPLWPLMSTILREAPSG